MRSLSLLPESIVLQFLEFADYQSRVRCVSCRKDWQDSLMKRFIRRLKLQSWSWDGRELLKRIVHLTTNPYDQLSLSLPPSNITSLLSGINFSINQLECEGHEISLILRSLERLRVKKLGIIFLENDKDKNSVRVNEIFSKIVDCQSLGFIFTLVQLDIIVPFLPSLQCLELRKTFISSDSLRNCLNNLHTLTLVGCDFLDHQSLSSLGSIPCLELIKCGQITNVSPLNHNDRIIIEKCGDFYNFFSAFANSRKIEIHLDRYYEYKFNLMIWTKVEDLTLISAGASSVYVLNHNHLPTAVKRCKLRGSFVAAINFTITGNHSLQEIHLSHDNTLKSLAGYKLERVAVITCDSLSALESLLGLGTGRNRKIVIRSCHKIEDFSPLNHLTFVEISDCLGFTDLSQVNLVQNLSLKLQKKVRMCAGFSPHSFMVSNAHYLPSFDGLQHIPCVQFDVNGDELIHNYVLERKPLFNAKISLEYGFRGKDAIQRILDLHEQYMKEQYDCDNRLPQKMIWFRKNQ